MKKSLSVLLAVILLVSCISVGFTGMSMVSAEGVSCTVTTEVEPQNGLNGGYIKSQASQMATSGGKVTLEAVPYYGNSFAGWYDGETLVSTNAKFDYTVTKDVELKAKFNIYNLIEDGNFATSAVGDTAPVSMARVHSASTATFKVIANNTSYSKFGNNILEYTSAGKGSNADYRDITIPFTAKKNTRYVLRFSFQNDNSAEVGFSVSKNEVHWPAQYPTINFGWIVTRTSTGKEYNAHGWSHAYKTNATLSGTFPTQKFTNALPNSGDAEWNDFEMIFDTLDNEGTLYVSIGVSSSMIDKTTLLANLQLSELTALPPSGEAKPVENGSFTVNRDPYINEEYKMLITAGGTKTLTYENVVYTLADKSPVTATAVPADGCALEAWYDKDGQQLTTNTTLSNYKTGDTPKFVKELDYEGGGIISDNGDGTFTAKPFYGNRLIGWYKNGQLVSSETVIKKADYIGAVAKFTTENWLVDGDFETGYSETANVYNSFPNYSPANRGTATVVEIPEILGTNDEYGSYALQIVPNTTSTQAGKQKSLLNIPVTLEAGKQYIWKFSYASLAKGVHNKLNNSIFMSVDKEYGNPDEPDQQIPWRYIGSINHVTYSFHTQHKSYYEANTKTPILDGIMLSTPTSSSSWGKAADQSVHIDNRDVSTSNEWNEVYVIITPKVSGNFFLTLGTWNTATDTYVFDNMSFTELFDGTGLTTAVVEKEDNVAHGVINSYLTDVAAFEATQVKGFEPIVTTAEKTGSIDPTKPLYAKMSYTYYADPDSGYTFDGWYNGDTLVSTNKKLTVCGYDGTHYVAKFKYDPSSYTANAVVENANGIYGGYITSSTVFEELKNGDSVTVSAVAYNGNEFLGWYNGSIRVAKTETATIEINENTTLTAKFEINNLITDSGYENTPAGTAVIGNDWSSIKTDAYGNIATDAAATGKKSISISSINHAFRYRNIAIEQNKTYHLGLNWMTSYAHSDASPIGLDYVAVKSSADGSVIAEYNPTEDVAALGKGKWQKATVNFNSGNAESVYFEIKYNGDIGLFYIDDIVLYDTEAAPFTITADIEKQEEIFPGYIKGEKTQTASYGESVTVTAVPYERNVFLGWYKDSVKVSESAEYTFTAEEFASLTAKFEVHNLVPDSGFENTPIGVSQSELGNWVTNSIWGFDVWAESTKNTPIKGSYGGDDTEINAYDGTVMLATDHRSPEIYTTLTGLKENTYYIFSFKWIIQYQSDGQAALHTVKLTGVQQNEELGAGRGVGIGAASTDQYQTVTIPFFSGQNTDILLRVGYKTSGNNTSPAALYIDNMSLYESDYITIVQSEGGKIETTFNGGQSGPAEKGQLIELTAVPDAGHTFVGWYDYTNPNKCLGTDTTYSFNADGALAITARWEGANAEPVNYFIDGDFENNCIIPPYFDHPFSGTEWCKYGITTSAGTLLPASGKQFLTLTANSRYTNFLISNLEPSTTYTVSFWYSGDAANEFTNIYMFERYGEYEHTDRDNKSTDMKVSPVRNYSKTDTYQYSVGSFMPNSINNAGKWQRGEFTFTTTNRREVYMHIENGGTGSFYFDDMKIVKGNTGGYTDEIVNGDFETPTAENGWYGDSFVTATEGTNTYGVTALNLVQGVNLRETTAYTLTFKARAPIGAELSYGITKGGATALTDANGNSNAISGAAKNTVTLTNQWQTYTLSFTSQGYLQNNIVFSANSEIHIDDVTLSKATGLANAARVDFETADQQTIGTNTLVTIGQYTSSNTYENGTYGSGNYAGKGYNNSFYEVVDTVSHTGSHSLVMRENAIKDVTDTTVSEKWTDSTDTVHEGTYALADPNSGFISHPLHQSWTRFKLRAGKAYTLTYYAKADKATEFKSMMVSIKSDWHYVEMAADEIKVGTDWTKVTQTFTMIDSMTTKNSMAFFVINGLNGKTDSDIYIDDIEIVETASSVIEEKETNLYTQDISQNYLTNFSFEKTEGTLGAYSTAASDAVYGEKIGSFKAGDKVIIPVSTRVDYNIEWASEYTFAASVRTNSGAEGFVGLSYSPDGSDRLASIENGKAVNLLSDTKGKWVRSGYTFSGFRLDTVYLVIECTKGSFQLDYLSLFNDNHGFDSFQNDHSITTFDPSDESNFVDMNTVGKGNHISGVLTGLPSGSKVVLKGAKTYESKVDSDGKWGFEKLDAGTYNMYVYAADASAATLWGDITFSDEGVSGLACERLNGEVIAIEGEGVRNGIVKVVDDDTEWAYLTTTDSDGQYTAYILDSNWYIAGTTNIAEALKTYNVTLEQFN